MDVRQLRYFIAAVEEGSLHGAAQRMNVAQPALSRRVRDLERSLGCDLLTRGARGVTPTLAGTTLYREAVLLLDRYEEAGRRTRRAALDGGRLVRVGLVPTARKYAFARDAIAAHRRREGSERLAFAGGASVDLAAGLRDGRLDVSLLYERHFGSAAFGERLIHRERYVLAVHPAHRLATDRPIALGELAGEPLVWLARRDAGREGDQLMQQCRLHGLEPVIDHTALGHDEQMDLVVVGTGACLTPASTILSTPPGMLRFRPLPGFAMELHLSLAWSRTVDAAAADPLIACFHATVDDHQAAIRAGSAPGARLFGHQVLRTEG